jgi:NAD(P)-dependent dehydrogenase (short-subunit alcohol dehydrogenase family)
VGVEPEAPVVLVTGTSSGIGRAAADRFVREGWTTFASARRLEAAREVAGAEPVALDVDDSASRERAIAEVVAKAGRLDVLVNNAGYGQMGPLLTVSEDELHAQFETNVFAPMALARLALTKGGMLARRRGRIVNVGSIVAWLPSPFAGPYCASKAALRALSDVLRVELAPLGIRVVQIEPGPIESRFSVNAGEEAARILANAGPYAPLRPFIEKRIGSSQRNPAPASAAADAIWRAASAPQPRARYTVTVQARVWKPLRALLPDRALDAILTRMFGLDRRLGD